MTLTDLHALVSQYRQKEHIIISDVEWNQVIVFIAPYQIVPATADRPAYFWFLDKRIVTPAYVEALLRA